MSEDWAKSTYDRFGRAVRHWRDMRGMSAQQLADRTKELGYPVSRGVIANWESGRKGGVDVCELVVIAEALRVDPPVLLYPAMQDEVDYLPHERVSTDDALMHYTGTDEGSTYPLRAWHDWREATARAARYARHGNAEASSEALLIAEQSRAQYEAGM
ncbi:helix-turn-helix domain-containing protein [Nocardia cyriacigeorgica]|uniref:helix-turn-helix domain-containing protein n=1 Tax=Nocardia cyriacigeorgica TaxID=135487 RepID=UPI0024569292|nr:helix-turn-helix transcriptional regulator [Nocardia cyriacigeorgica]